LKVAVVSDIHANQEALVAVLGQIGETDVLCLGDLVDYGAEPNEVIALLRDKGVAGLMGNHDYAAISGDTSSFNPKAAMSSIWTKRQLTSNSQSYLRTLPGDLRPKFTPPSYFTHGSPDDRLWEYVDPRTHSDLFGHYLDKMKVSIIGLGHTHIPYVWREGVKVVFNPGSVGQPRDGDWRASYALLTIIDGGVEVQIRRVEYDVEGAAAKIRNAGLPEFFADRLKSGT
jgi:diadenosine tetraphosphatase ApaH/serine/threonine PP2A family protein phosphatase